MGLVGGTDRCVVGLENRFRGRHGGFSVYNGRYAGGCVRGLI